jgi:ribonuclease D
MCERIKNKVDISIQSDLSENDLLRLRACSELAVDCEMTGLNPHRDLLCVVQLCDSNGEINIIKTREWSNAKNLQCILNDTSITKVFHFAIMDCAFLYLYLNMHLDNIYCTKIASKIARTYAPKHSLTELTKEFLSIDLDKRSGVTFWCAEQLTPEQIDYAANDVIYLLDCKKHLEQLLEQKGVLKTGLSYRELNERTQKMVPTLVYLWVNGWDFGKEDTSSIFGR